MPTLSEVQREAELLSADLYRSRYLGGMPIEASELDQFFADVIEADPDDSECDVYSETSDAARAFSRCISAVKPNEADCREALAVLLQEIGVCRDRKNARKEVDVFVRIILTEVSHK